MYKFCSLARRRAWKRRWCREPASTLWRYRPAICGDGFHPRCSYGLDGLARLLGRRGASSDVFDRT